MTVDVEGIALCLGSSVEVVTFPFDATKRLKMTLRTTNKVVDENQQAAKPIVDLDKTVLA